MKKYFTIAIFCLITLALNSQTPKGFNYQAIARDGGGNLIT
jgi:hypothetical protein